MHHNPRFLNPAFFVVGSLAASLSFLSGCIPESLYQPNPKQRSEQERIFKAIGNPIMQETLSRRLDKKIICITARFASNQPDPSQPTFYAFLQGESTTNPFLLGKATNTAVQDSKIILEELTKVLGKTPKNFQSFLVIGAGQPPTCQELMQAQP
jgi:hypothetical protein